MVCVAASLLLLLFSDAAISESQDDDDPYYGVPVGALHYSSEGTQAEVYAADEYTIVFHRFTHRPKEEGCTAIMVGPKRAADRDAVRGEGVLLAISQPLFASVRPRIRPRRQAPFNMFTMNNWPVEFDHLKMPQGERSRSVAFSLDPFAGIELDVGQSVEAQPQAKEILIDSVPDGKDTNAGENDDGFQKHSEAASAFEVTSTAGERARNLARVRGAVTSRTTTTTENSLNTGSVPTNTSARDGQSSVTGRERATSHTDEALTDSSVQPSAAAIIFFRKPSEKRTTMTMADNQSEEIETAFTPRRVSTSSDYAAGPIGNTAESHFASSLSNNLHAISTTSMPRLVSRLGNRNASAKGEFRYHKENEQEDGGASSYVEWVTKADGLVRSNRGQTILFGGATTTDWPRRAPFRNHAMADKIDRTHTDKDDLILSDKFFETDNIVPVSTQGFATPSSSSKSTPLYYVIEDPRAKRRRQKERAKGVLSPLEQQMGGTGPPMAMNAHLDRKYALHVVEDKTAAFALTNGAKIVDYQWIGLYDQCKKRAIPLLSLKGIDPPREEKIAPISGWSHNVTSYRVQILNCNSLLIPGFVYNDTDAPAGTFFYVGIGHFPDNIEKQVRTEVVGHPLNEPLRSYMREDVMLRLPKTYRTFDIDFLSIYNEAEKRSYGHVVIPSLLVPPCTEID